jgi:hypothetical protein
LLEIEKTVILNNGQLYTVLKWIEVETKKVAMLLSTALSGVIEIPFQWYVRSM